MADTQKPRVLDEDARLEFAAKKAKRRYKSQVRKYRRDAENSNSELNLTAMMDMMTILLVFLIKSYGAAEINVAISDDLTPPTSRSMLAPVEAVTVTITKKDIAVGEKGVVRLGADGSLPAEVRDPDAPLLIVPVKEALDREVEKLQQIATFNSAMAARAGTDKDPVRMLTIVADKDTPYELLFSVLGTAGQSGLKYFKFLVIGAD